MAGLTVRSIDDLLEDLAVHSLSGLPAGSVSPVLLGLMVAARQRAAEELAEAILFRMISESPQAAFEKHDPVTPREGARLLWVLWGLKNGIYGEG